ncbi:hypothetical protein IAU60_003504 [Kwoniella sp. DSM 27419]
MARQRDSKGLDSVLEQLLDDYRDLQNHEITRLAIPPTPLQVLRMIYSAHPAVIQGHSPLRPAATKYDWRKPDIYSDTCGSTEVTVAITDDGLADSVRGLPGGGTTFVKAFEDKMTISELISKLGPKETGKGKEGEAYYLQSQDGNIYRSVPRPNGPPELASFQDHIQRDVEWMREAVGDTAEAVNLWIGDSKSTTSLHHDPYENIYHVLAGTKTFTLLSPIEGLWLDQHFHPASTLHRSPSGHLRPELDPAPSYPIPWVSSTSFPYRVRPIRVTLNEGETLYLPAGWWHRVEQAETDHGIVAAVNYWYTAEIHPQAYAYERFARRIARLAGRHGVIPVPGDEGDGDDEQVTEEDAEVPDDVWGSEDSGEEWNPADWGR